MPSEQQLTKAIINMAVEAGEKVKMEIMHRRMVQAEVEEAVVAALEYVGQ